MAYSTMHIALEITIHMQITSQWNYYIILIKLNTVRTLLVIQWKNYSIIFENYWLDGWKFKNKQNITFLTLLFIILFNVIVSFSFKDICKRISHCIECIPVQNKYIHYVWSPVRFFNLWILNYFFNAAFLINNFKYFAIYFSIFSIFSSFYEYLPFPLKNFTKVFH